MVVPRVAELINHLSSIAESTTYRFWRDAFEGPEYLSAVEADLASMVNPANPREANVSFKQHFNAIPLRATATSNSRESCCYWSWRHSL